MKKYFIFIASIFSFSCTNGSIEKNKDDFYYSDSYTDCVRLPVVKPYEVLKLNGTKEWVLNLITNELQSSISNIKKVNVINNTIILYSSDSTYLKGTRVFEAWFVIVPSEHIEKGFSKKADFVSYLERAGIKLVQFYNIDSAFSTFSEAATLPWRR